MQKNISMKPCELLFSAIFAIFLLTGCSVDKDPEMNKGETPLEMKVSSEEIELDAANPEVEALRFTWTSGSNRGSNAAIDYVFKMDVRGNNFGGGVSLSPGREIYEKAYRNEELNEILIRDFGVSPGEEISMESCITAIVASDEIPPETSDILTITVKTHKPVAKTLYLIGDATPNGWNANKATEMRPVSGVPKAFTWTGPLTVGNFKFIVSQGDFVPSYNKGDDATRLYLRESADDSYDERFEISEAGTYVIKVNLITLSISIVKGEGPEYTRLWLVGNPTGWSFNPMRVNPLDPFVFHYNDELSAGGEFKIGTVENSWNAVFLRPAIDQTADGLDLDVVKWAGDPDYKWNITGGVYKIKLDTREMKINIATFAPYPMIYLVGDATPTGWDVGNAVPMTPDSDPYKFTWTGNLRVGEMKFSCDRQSDWNGAWFLANENGATPSGETEQMLFSSPGSNPDNKWII